MAFTTAHMARMTPEERARAGEQMRALVRQNPGRWPFLEAMVTRVEGGATPEEAVEAVLKPGWVGRLRAWIASRRGLVFGGVFVDPGMDNR